MIDYIIGSIAIILVIAIGGFHFLLKKTKSNKCNSSCYGCNGCKALVEEMKKEVMADKHK